MLDFRHSAAYEWRRPRAGAGDRMRDLDLVNEVTRNAYNLVASKYDELFRDELERKEYDRRILERFSRYFTKDSLLLDLGCGPSGHITAYLRGKGLHISGIDISERCIEIASRLHPEIEFLRMDMSDLRLADQSADGLVAFYAIIHTPKRLVGRYFREFRRVLKRGGKLLLSVKEGDEEGYLEEFLGHGTRIYFSHFRAEEIERYLAGNGFRTLLLESRRPYDEEIPVPRIYAIGERL